MHMQMPQTMNGMPPPIAAAEATGTYPVPVSGIIDKHSWKKD